MQPAQPTQPATSEEVDTEGLEKGKEAVEDLDKATESAAESTNTLSTNLQTLVDAATTIA